MHYTCIVVLPPVDEDDEFPSLGMIQSQLENILAVYNENEEFEEYKQREVSLTDALDAYGVSVELSPDGKPVWTPGVLTALADYHGVDDADVGFDEEGLFLTSKGNPDGKWDWWVIGGRWQGFWKAKPGAESLLGESGSFANSAEHDADVIRKCDIDFTAAREEAAKRISDLWDEMMLITDPTKRSAFSYQHGLSEILGRDKSIQRAVSNAEGTSHALIDLDGEWHVSGDMWTRPDYQELLKESNRDRFRSVSKELEDEWDQIVFPTLWRAIPDNAIVALVDYHS
jgi:hypothetical protein